MTRLRVCGGMPLGFSRPPLSVFAVWFVRVLARAPLTPDSLPISERRFVS